MLLTLGVLCAVYAPVTALGFSVEETLPMLCLCGVLVAGVCGTLWGGRGLLAATLAALLALFFAFDGVVTGARAALSMFTGELSDYTAVPHLFADATATAGEMTLFFGAVGIGLSLVLAFALLTRHSGTLGALALLPVVVPAFSFVPYPPDLWCAVGLLGFVVALVFWGGMTQDRATSRDRRRAGRALPALALAGVLLGAGYLIAPPQQYDRSDWSAPLLMAIKDAIPALEPILQQFDGTGLAAPNIGVWFFNTSKISIADAGPRTNHNRQILQITTDVAGTYYLRGSSMETFNGRGWVGGHATSYTQGISSGTNSHRIPTRLAQLRSSGADNAPPLRSMTILNTADLSGILYLPYYTDYTRILAGDMQYQSFWMSDSFLSSQAREHSVMFYDPEESLLAVLDTTQTNSYIEYDMMVDSTYTQVEEETAQALRALAAEAGIDATADRATVAAQVAEYVRSAARYDLNTEPAPEGVDFAVYFLTESKQGYCVHFATAATLMLRALGIPARFTTGFMVTVPARLEGRAASVTDSDAHAWVEVFYTGLGWVPLEVTAAYQNVAGAAAAYTPPDDDDLLPPVDPNDRPTPSPTPSASPTPSPTGAGQSPTQPTPKKPLDPRYVRQLTVLAGVAALLAVVILIRLARKLTQKRRTQRLYQSDTNAAVIYAWRYICRLTRYGQHPPAEIEDIAVKARFSQHTLTQEEWQTVVRYATALAGRTDAESNALGRLWLRYVRRLT